jgi:LuxR family maltose regulon positive regulatory protein
MDLNYQYTLWLGWVKALPEDVIRARPVVSVGYAWGLLGTGELEASEARLRDAERWLEPADKKADDSPANDYPERSQRMVVVDEAEFRSLPASIAAARAYRALALGDIPATKMYARQTLAFSPEETSPHRTQGTALLGLAEYASGDLQAAEQELLKFQAMMWQVNDIASAIGITFALANIKLVQGSLREAISAYQQSLQLAVNRGASFFIGVSDLYRGLSGLLCEQNDLEAAAQYLVTAQQMGEQGATTGWAQRLYVAQARLKESQGDLAGALVLLEEAERQYVRNPLPDPPVAALKARTWVRQGRLIDAFSWAREQNLSPDDDLSYLREFEHLTLARALMARYKSDQADDDLHAALALLVRLLQAAEEGGRNGSVIEILILQSLALQAQGDRPRALASLERALTLAEPEGYVRIFVDEGEAMKLLISDFRHLHRAADAVQVLTIAIPTHPLLGYVDRVLDFFPQTVAESPQSKIANQKPEMVEPLTDRELEILCLIAEGYSNTEISQRLFLALSTVKGHNLRVFNKLQAHNRTEAVARARELGLL